MPKNLMSPHEFAKELSPNHIVDANKKVEPVASVNSIRDSIGQGTINILKDGLNPGDYLYTHPTPPSESEGTKELWRRINNLEEQNGNLLNTRDDLIQENHELRRTAEQALEVLEDYHASETDIADAVTNIKLVFSKLK